MAAVEEHPVANPKVVLREEFDDWAILFDPDSGDAFGLNPVGVLIWKHLDGKHTLEDILRMLRDNCKDVPDNGMEHIKEFTSELVERGFVGYETDGNSEI